MENKKGNFARFNSCINYILIVAQSKIYLSSKIICLACAWKEYRSVKDRIKRYIDIMCFCGKC